VIVLLTDFGESEYVGVMKGVIYSLCPSEHIVDLTHSIPPQSVRVDSSYKKSGRS